MQKISAILIVGRLAKDRSDRSDRSAVPAAVQVPALEIASPSKSQNLKRQGKSQGVWKITERNAAMPACRNT